MLYQEREREAKHTTLDFNIRFVNLADLRRDTCAPWQMVLAKFSRSLDGLPVACQCRGVIGELGQAHTVGGVVPNWSAVGYALLRSLILLLGDLSRVPSCVAAHISTQAFRAEASLSCGRSSLTPLPHDLPISRCLGGVLFAELSRSSGSGYDAA